MGVFKSSWGVTLQKNEARCDLTAYCFSSFPHYRGLCRHPSHSAWTSGLLTRPAIAASCADVSVKTVLCLQRQGCQARTVCPSPTRHPVPSSCLCGFVLTADARWRRRTDTLLWNSHWGWVTCLWRRSDLRYWTVIGCLASSCLGASS